MNLITPDFGIIFWQSVTFLAVVLILGKFAWNPILQTINEREGYIKQSLEDAHEAEKLLMSVREEQAQLLANANRARERVINEAIATKNAILDSATNEANQINEKMLAAAKDEIKQERTMAVDQLKNEVWLLSVQVAEKLIDKELDSNHKQEELVRRLIQENNPN